MKKIITALLALTFSASTFSQSKSDSLQKQKVDTVISFNVNKAIGLFNLLNLSQEALAHTTSQKITVDQANQATEGVTYFQKLIKEWVEKFQSSKPVQKK